MYSQGAGIFLIAGLYSLMIPFLLILAGFCPSTEPWPINSFHGSGILGLWYRLCVNSLTSRKWMYVDERVIYVHMCRVEREGAWGLWTALMELWPVFR